MNHDRIVREWESKLDKIDFCIQAKKTEIKCHPKDRDKLTNECLEYLKQRKKLNDAIKRAGNNVIVKKRLAAKMYEVELCIQKKGNELRLIAGNLGCLKEELTALEKRRDEITAAIRYYQLSEKQVIWPWDAIKILYNIMKRWIL